MRFIILLTFLLATNCVLNAQNICTTLEDVAWRFREHPEGKKRGGEWTSAVVPGCVHTDLIRAEKIKHPFYGTAEADCQWVEKKSWEYETLPFDVPTSVFSKSNIKLRFNGLDTYAHVQLNGKEILSTNNAHRSWEVDVKPHLKKEGNVLLIVFDAATERALEVLHTLPYPIPGDSMRAVVRKPQFHFGWDWGPRLVTCGITKPIDWIAFDEAHLTDLYFEQLSVNDEIAEILVHGILTTSQQTTVQLRVTGKNNGGTWSQELHVDTAGQAEFKLPVTIHQPLFWWCNGQGNSSLYAFDVDLVQNNQVISHHEKRIGIRDIQLITQRDSIGESFYFELNGQPVFMKGANYIPLRYFPGEATEADYIQLIRQCKDAHINMLRVWGGGVYEEEIFYDLCDQNGIMVWHDFMFACSMYPGDDAFMQNVAAEATEQVKRLRNHPCIALWCGNNENSEGWERWGWKSGLTQEEVATLQKGYDDLFRQLLPDVVARHCKTDYWESSPRLGRGDTRSIIEGDSHYWGVWHDEEPFEVLQVKVPRFMSEYGMQSFPSSSVLVEMTDDKMNLSDKGIIQHQKHARGFSLMEKYMNSWYPKVSTTDMNRYAEMTQAVQAEGIGLGIEAQRRAMPRCMGTLYWQLNDVWPSFSWSSIDYKGTPKLLHEYLKTIYAPQLISCTVKDDQLQIWWISDTRIDNDSMKLDFSIYEGTLYKGEPDEHLRSKDVAIYHSPVLGCRIGYGSSLLYSIQLKELGLTSIENLLIEARVSYPSQANPEFKRIQKLIPKSSAGIVPCLSVQSMYDAKTRKKSERTTVMFKSGFVD